MASVTHERLAWLNLDITQWRSLYEGASATLQGLLDFARLSERHPSEGLDGIPDESGEEPMMDPGTYLARVRAAASSAAQYLPSDVMREVDELIEHGEPAEGLCSLAWAIVNAKVRVPRELIDAIYKYTSGLVDEKHLPPDLADYADGYR